MAVATRKENYCTRRFGRNNSLCLWDNPTLQPAEFGRVYAAYGGIFIVSSIIWGRIVDKKKPDTYEIIGSIVAVIGTLVIFYAPR
jgi:drug/metabolite transporter superfamily protein YnfA